MALAISGLRRCTHPAGPDAPRWMNALFAVIWVVIIVTVLYVVTGALAFYLFHAIPPF